MDGAHRNTASPVIQNLFEHPEQYSFFKAVEILLAEYGEEIEENALQEQASKSLLFRVDPSLGFPSSDITHVISLDNSTRTAMTVTFLGLNGASSPLPDYMIETANWSKGEEGVQQAFHDFFSNRLIWLFYLAWRKYRYYVRFKPGASDQFSEWMFSLIGIAGEKTRSTANIPWAKMLTYIGVVAAQTRSVQTISGVISHAFNLPDVKIREFELRSVDIVEDQQVRLGRVNSILGGNFSIGHKIQDRMGKFTVVLHGLSFDRFRDFLPRGREHTRLKELVEFLLKDQLAYDIELKTVAQDVPNFVLGQENYSNLGWTTFIRHQSIENVEISPVVLQGRA